MENGWLGGKFVKGAMRRVINSFGKVIIGEDE